MFDHMSARFFKVVSGKTRCMPTGNSPPDKNGTGSVQARKDYEDHTEEDGSGVPARAARSKTSTSPTA